MTSGGEAQQEVEAGLDIAMQWAKLPAKHLEIALHALEPQLKREHQARMAELEAEAERARLKAAEVQAKRTQALYLTGLIAGLVISVTMLVAAVFVAEEATWLAVLLSGPSLITLTSLLRLWRAEKLLGREVSESEATKQEGETGQERPAPQ
ncbi:hypothetical protein [Streptomyces umbrinus]|uniref:hypothetical protein n=1 Tax=Streptomyces umbrinus TaxID=67370 RepID=UPI0033F5AEE7